LGEATDKEFQAWLYPDGRIRYVYAGELSDDDTRDVGLFKDDVEGVDYTPSRGESLLYTPLSEAWVTNSPSTGSVAGHNAQAITYTVDAADQEDGTTNIFTTTVTWEDGSTDEVVVTVRVGGSAGDADVGMTVTPNHVSFVGPAGIISQTNITLVNTGEVALTYTFTDTTAQDAGYVWERIKDDYDWDSSNWDFHSGEFVPTDKDEGISELFPIGFNFLYYGNVYTQFSIGVNGAISCHFSG